jgi:hypothetical protein
MTIDVKVNNLAKRALVALVALGSGALLLFAAVSNCAVGLLTDPRVNVSRELLAAGIRLVPSSAPLNARLAEMELQDEDRDIVDIERRATRAVNSSPWDYRYRLLLATVKEAQGDRPAAEQSLQQALALAPNSTDVHWRFANLLLRQGRLARAVVEFRAANAANISLLAGTLDLLWRVSAGSLATVQAVTPRDPRSQLILAQFLLKRSRAADAITVCSGIERGTLVSLPEFSPFIDSLVSEGRLDEARGLWFGVVGGVYARPGSPLPGLWNGSLESDIVTNLAQFDWTMTSNEYAKASIDANASHSGNRSLRIEFSGRDTTRLDGQVKQLVLVNPGGSYRLECYVKTERFESPEGPRVVVADFSNSSEIASTSPIPAGTNDWRRIAIDFKAPASARAAVVTIKRIPQFSFDKPTRGTIWLDDFVLTEITK